MVKAKIDYGQGTLIKAKSRFRAVMTSWMYEHAKRHMSRNTEAYQSFQLDIGPGAYKRAFLTHRNAVTMAVKRVAGAPCVT